MKIAYLGFDSSCTKAYSFFENFGCDVSYFLKAKDQKLNIKPFSSLEIFVDHLTIPSQQKLRTQRQNQVFKMIEEDYLELKENLNPVLPELSANFTTGDLKINQLTSINDLQFDGKQKKIFIELDKKGVDSFDFVFIEAHPFIADILNEKKIKPFRQQVETKYSWCSVDFAMDYLKPIEPILQQKMFFVVQDPLRKSLVDNWFFCDFQNRQLDVWGYVPYRQVANPEFMKFYIDRVRNFISHRFKFIFLKEFLQSKLCTVGALDNSTAMTFQQTAGVSNFMFWSEAQVTNYLDHLFAKKLRNLKLVSEGVRRD